MRLSIGAKKHELFQDMGSTGSRHLLMLETQSHYTRRCGLSYVSPNENVKNHTCLCDARLSTLFAQGRCSLLAILTKTHTFKPLPSPPAGRQHLSQTVLVLVSSRWWSHLAASVSPTCRRTSFPQPPKLRWSESSVCRCSYCVLKSEFDSLAAAIPNTIRTLGFRLSQLCHNVRSFMSSGICLFPFPVSSFLPFPVFSSIGLGGLGLGVPFLKRRLRVRISSLP